MKALLFAMGSSFLSAIDPGCSAAAGSDVARVPDAGEAVVPVGDTSCGAGTHTFCDDFKSTSLPSLFDSEDLFSGVNKIDGTRSVSAPYALLSTTSRITQGSRTNARLKKAFSQTGSHFTLAYSEYVDSTCLGNGDAVETGVIGLRDNSYWVALRHGNNGDSILEAGLAQNSLAQSHQLTGDLPRDAWARVVLAVDLEKKTVDLTVNGAKKVEAEPLKDAPTGAQASQIEVGVLVDNLLAPPTPCTIGIDDVAFDVSP
jgi:hypothetical protein